MLLLSVLALGLALGLLLGSLGISVVMIWVAWLYVWMAAAVCVFGISLVGWSVMRGTCASLVHGLADVVGGLVLIATVSLIVPDVAQTWPVILVATVFGVGRS